MSGPYFGVAVVIGCHVALRLIALLDAGLGIAVPIDVGVGVPNLVQAFVGLAVAAVVDLVAALGRARADLGLRVVAVLRVVRISCRLHARALRVQEVAVAILVTVDIPQRSILIDGPIAIVIHVVAEVVHTRLDQPSVIIAVERVRHIPIDLRYAGQDTGSAVTVAVSVFVLEQC